MSIQGVILRNLSGSFGFKYEFKQPPSADGLYASSGINPFDLGFSPDSLAEPLRVSEPMSGLTFRIFHPF